MKKSNKKANKKVKTYKAVVHIPNEDGTIYNLINWELTQNDIKRLYSALTPEDVQHIKPTRQTNKVVEEFARAVLTQITFNLINSTSPYCIHNCYLRDEQRMLALTTAMNMAIIDNDTHEKYFKQAMDRAVCIVEIELPEKLMRTIRGKKEDYIDRFPEIEVSDLNDNIVHITLYDKENTPIKVGSSGIAEPELRKILNELLNALGLAALQSSHLEERLQQLSA